VSGGNERLWPANWRSPLLWGEAGWGVACAFLLYAGLRTGLAGFAYAGAAVALTAWIRARHHYRQIADIPTVRLASAPQGRVELQGSGAPMPEYPVHSPLTGLPCLWFDYTVERGEGRQRRVVRADTSTLPFALRDGDRQAVVLPEGAQVISRHRQRWRSGDETYTESVLLAGEPLYVLGEYVHDWTESDGHRLERQAGALLQEWKQDQAALTQRFDANGDGVIDMHEWEAARRQAEREVLTGGHRPIKTEQQIRRPKSGGAFIISNYSAAQLAARFRRWSWLHLGVFFAALAVAGWR